MTGEIEIQASEDGQYGIMNEETYTLILRITKLQNSIWDNYSIQVSVSYAVNFDMFGIGLF